MDGGESRWKGESLLVSFYQSTIRTSLFAIAIEGRLCGHGLSSVMSAVCGQTHLLRPNPRSSLIHHCRARASASA